MTVGGIDLTADAIAAVAAGFVAAGAALGILVAALNALLRAVDF